MNTGPKWQRSLRRALVILGTGGMMLQVGSGCDPQVRSTILGGFQQLATTFVTAFFQGLAAQETPGPSAATTPGGSTA